MRIMQVGRNMSRCIRPRWQIYMYNHELIADAIAASRFVEASNSSCKRAPPITTSCQSWNCLREYQPPPSLQVRLNWTCCPRVHQKCEMPLQLPDSLKPALGLANGPLLSRPAVKAGTVCVSLNRHHPCKCDSIGHVVRESIRNVRPSQK